MRINQKLRIAFHFYRKSLLNMFLIFAPFVSYCIGDIIQWGSRRKGEGILKYAQQFQKQANGVLLK